MFYSIESPGSYNDSRVFSLRGLQDLIEILPSDRHVLGTENMSTVMFSQTLHALLRSRPRLFIYHINIASVIHIAYSL